MSSRLWELGKKASIGGLVVISLPVLVPSAVVLAFAGALLAVPVGSAAVGFLLLKKILQAPKHYLEWSPGSSEEGQGSVRDDGEAEKEDPVGASSSACSENLEAGSKKEDRPEPAFGEISCEEAPEDHGEPGKSSEDYIVVEKPPSDPKTSVELEEKEDDEDGSKIEKAESQCKGSPDFYQCVEVELADDDDGGATGAKAHDHDGDRDKESGVKVDADKDEGSGSKDQGVGLSVIPENTNKRSSPENPEEESGGAKKKIAAAPDSTKEVHASSVENGGSSVEGQDHSKEEPRSSVDEYASMTEDFPEEPNAVSSDESVTSARNAAAAAAAAKPEVKTSSRSRKRKSALAFARRLLRLKS
ncbi:midasin isoform X3 [Selaginella moellendorffii]|uniref:midasin isoform X3 n=1 Tax=Selaginella moellendorffii TaxID=88036 RepID=UPI000D1C4C17|nr:midasin isoform X3 [Selaginella moellendorffii]|eukprot:XP_024516240.1 midasin isoform X3 [Selaginella moellendorffii]